jgi:hypothetical protein
MGLEPLMITYQLYRIVILSSFSLLTLASCDAPIDAKFTTQSASKTPETIAASTAPPELTKSPQPAGSSVETATSVKTPVAATPALSTSPTPSTTTQSEATEFRFMVGDTNKIKDPRIVSEGTHPCGTAAIARVTILPNVDTKDGLIPDKVVEVDEQNNTIRRWAKPLDSELIAVAGDRILVDIGDKKRYWIDPTGNFQRQTDSISPAMPTFDSRVKTHPEFKNSGYAGLWRFSDLNAGNNRRIIYEGNCT